jgi:parallel beta-helix repeat protein
MAWFKIAVIFLGFALLGSAKATTIIVDPGHSIQAAIYAARPGDTVEVHDGVYYEHLNVNKQLTLRGINMPLLDATASGSAITLSADGVILQGFRTINSGLWPSDGSEEAGIKIISNNNVIENNNASNNSNGIFIISGYNNTVTSNTASGNLGFGIKLTNCSKNGIFRNNFDRNYKDNAYDDDANQWDNSTTGNHYSDFDSPAEGCKDLNANGICDSSYAIQGGLNTDHHPSVHPFSL